MGSIQSNVGVHAQYAGMYKSATALTPKTGASANKGAPNNAAIAGAVGINALMTHTTKLMITKVSIIFIPVRLEKI